MPVLQSMASLTVFHGICCSTLDYGFYILPWRDGSHIPSLSMSHSGVPSLVLKEGESVLEEDV